MLKKRAFTLIELLVVIAIIAILAAILFPVFAQAKAAAKTSVTLSNTKQLALAHTMYTNDYDDMSVVPWRQYGVVGPNGDSGIFPPQLFYPYIKNLGVFWDAAAPVPNLGAITNPTAPGQWGQAETISWNEWAMYSSMTGQPKVMSSLQYPAEQMLLVPLSNPNNSASQGGQDGTYTGGDIGWYCFDGLEQSCYDTANTDWADNPTAGIARAANSWHAGQYVSGFVDGHAHVMKGMTLATTGCGGKTYNFWANNFSSGTPADTALKASDDWSAFFIQPRVLHYYGEWWNGN